MLKTKALVLEEFRLAPLMAISSSLRLAPAAPKGPVPVTGVNAPAPIFNSIADEGISGQPVVQTKEPCAKAAVELLK
jgi:hypothetical protein